jgi:hypothetical protein
MKLGRKQVGSIYGRSSMQLSTIFQNQNGVRNSNRGPSIYASYHVSVNLAKLFQSRRFLEIDQSETRIACGGHFLGDISQIL